MTILDLLLLLSLFIIMIGIGLSIKISDFLKEIKKPKHLIFGVILQIIVFPLITFFIIKDAPLNDIWKVGFMLLASCPSGVLSNLLSTIFKGKPALSIEITALNSIVSLFTIPIYTGFAIKYFLGDIVKIVVPLNEFIPYLFLVTIIPGIIGVLIRNKNRTLAKKINKKTRNIGTILFFLTVLMKLFWGVNSTPIASNHIKTLLPWVLLINVVVILIGYLISFILKFKKQEEVTFAAEIGIQNTTFALILAETILNHPSFGSPALIYAVTSLPISWLALYIVKKFFKKQR